MQCVSCHHTFEADSTTGEPVTCPDCGAEQGLVAVATAEPDFAEPVFSEVAPATEEVDTKAKKAKPAKTVSGGRRMLNDLLVTFLFVAAVLLAVASTLVAMRTMKERDELKEQAAKTGQTVNQIVSAAVGAKKLNADDRKAILAPAIAYYQQVAVANRENPEHYDLAAAAFMRSAGLQAKSGNGALVSDIKGSAEMLKKMKDANYDPARYPSLSHSALNQTAPLEWAMVKDTSREIHAMGLLQSFVMTSGTLRELANQHPQNPTFREDLAGLQKISGTLQAMVPGRQSFALEAWLEARDQLESLLRDQPGNAEYQARLVEALTALANLQKQDDKKDEAIANLKRAVEVREQMAQANPDDKALSAALSKAKTDLAKLEPAG